jgi:hypothetical protein
MRFNCDKSQRGMHPKVLPLAFYRTVHCRVFVSIPAARFQATLAYPHAGQGQGRRGISYPLRLGGPPSSCRLRLCVRVGKLETLLHAVLDGGANSLSCRQG